MAKRKSIKGQTTI